MRPTSCLLLAAFALAACDDDDSTPAAPTPTVAITADNALAVAASAWRTAFDPVRACRIAAGFLEVPPPPPEPPGADAVVVQEIPGPEGGSALFTWEDLDEDASYSTGDLFSVVFADYGADQLVLTGAVTFADVRVQGDVLTGLSWILDARLELLGLQVVEGARTTTLDGDFDCRSEKRATVDLLELAAVGELASGASTLRDGSFGGRNDYLLDFSMALLADGVFDDPDLGGTLLFRSDGVMTGIQVLPDPSAGLFVVDGAAGSSVTLVPLDYFTLELQVDADGDGEPELTIPAEWAEL